MNTDKSELSLLALANVEALAQEYGGELPCISVTCPQPSESYGDCREQRMGFVSGQYYAICRKIDNPKRSCYRSDEGVV